ncbi:MAG: hypothetical protein R2726_20820 [Acidimicrobiales bacterium]
MARRSDDARFTRHQKVVAAVDLPDVPAGTPGKVLMVNGLSWIRYHVLFDNGVKRSAVRDEWLATRDDWAAKEQAAARERRRAEREAERAAALSASEG